MKKIILTLFSLMILIPVVSEAATPKSITVTQCNIKVRAVQKKLDKANKVIWLFQAFSYDTMSYVVCLWWAMRYENDFVDCDNLYLGYRNDWNMIARLWRLEWSITDSE